MFSGPGLVVAVAGQRAQFVMAMIDDAGTGPTRPQGVLIQVSERERDKEHNSRLWDITGHTAHLGTAMSAFG